MVASVVPRVLLMSVTVAPGMTPPCASLMFPVTVPVVTCAAAGIAGAQTAITIVSTRRVVLNIRAPPLAPRRDPPLALSRMEPVSQVRHEYTRESAEVKPILRRFAW